ncbi:hypothetical protein [Tepidiforma thermophila]|uniref:Uncharacterized protein n=1 Tax=Tepidiforma thermophila (strain KCTC 52669 / CGMCC 1.13589 / G233) TaxID=2761530 RepID=A0A2A9HCX7_TEPT2|nr:hypothetical protein [Tepidiforma thermophila]PFG73628.1 hypothetical protein A9A59_0830 [Tepidiforma thermophila]
MQYAISPSTILPRKTVYRETELNLARIREAATRLRSWALVSGERIVGLPFIRVRSDLLCEVHLPVDGNVQPHPQTGVFAHTAPESPAVSLRVVRFDELRAVIRELSGEIAVDCGSAGPVEFHPSTAEFTHGTLLWPVHRLSPALAPAVAIPGRRTLEAAS